MPSFHKFENRRVLRGALLNPNSDTHCDLYMDGLLVSVEKQGQWVVEHCGDAATIASQIGWELDAIPHCQAAILPPFYDSHFHWVQDDVRDMPKESLLEWLEKYTFPAEHRFADPDYAEEKARSFWKRILSLGTVGGFCYSSIHDCALDAALRHAPKGFRIGNALMTMNCPDFLQQSHEEAIRSASDAAKRHGKRYVVTPRFAPTTAPAVLTAGSQIASRHDLFQQTHLSETPAEIDWVLGMYRAFPGFEEVSSYTEIYERCDMLGPKTIMGHAIHLSEEEWRLLSQTDTAIASCPTSNAPVGERGLGSGLFDFAKAENHGVRWALASDIGGGPFLSMFDVMESFVHQNRQLGISSASYVKALFRSTSAGAILLDIQDRKGNLAPGKDFDCILCQLPPDYLAYSNAEDLIAAIIHQTNTREGFHNLVTSCIIEGKHAFERDTPEGK